MLDSPVTADRAGREAASLALWVGGERDLQPAQERARRDGDKARYVGPIGAGSVPSSSTTVRATGIQTALAEMFSVGVKAGRALALWKPYATAPVVGDAPSTAGRSVLPGKYEPAAFALRLAHKT